MDPLLGRLLLKTNDLKEIRPPYNVLAPSIFNLCLESSENDLSTRNATMGINIFDSQSMAKTLILLENLQQILNGNLAS
jgi:hypothetical protein